MSWEDGRSQEELDAAYPDYEVSREDDEAMWQQHLREDQDKAARILSIENYSHLMEQLDIMQSTADGTARYDAAARAFADGMSELYELTSASPRSYGRTGEMVMNDVEFGMDTSVAEMYRGEVKRLIVGSLPFERRIEFLEEDLAHGANWDPRTVQEWCIQEAQSRRREHDLDLEWVKNAPVRAIHVANDRVRSGLDGDERDLSFLERDALGFGKSQMELRMEAIDVGKMAVSRFRDFARYVDDFRDRHPEFFDEQANNRLNKQIVAGLKHEKDFVQLEAVDLTRKPKAIREKQEQEHAEMSGKKLTREEAYSRIGVESVNGYANELSNDGLG